jgi:protein gp37
MNNTIISWATKTLNVVHGCSKPAAIPEHALHYVDYPFDSKWMRSGTSPECHRCYAEALSNKRGWTPKPWLERNEADNVQLHPERFRELAKLPVKPTHWPASERERIFICSMGDTFHRLVPDSFLRDLWVYLVRYPHIYQMLTKRPERAAKWDGPWPENIWLGATCGHPTTKWRLNALRDSGAQVRFVSMEPMVDSMLPLNLAGIHQVIVGGESGSGYRPMNMRWVREVRDACAEQGVALFFKQDAAFKTETRCYLVEEDGRCMQYRQWPGSLTLPIEVEPDNPKWHRTAFPILGQTA